MQLFLAGAEAWFDTMVSLGVPNMLFSYYYLRRALISRGGARGRALLGRMRQAKEAGYTLMLDSGAFTYHEKSQDPEVTLPDPAGYFKEYKYFVMEYGDLFDIIAEFDVDTSGTASVQQVDQWTNELLSLPEIGKHVMPVYHPHRGDAWLDDWLRDTRSPLVGMTSAVVGQGIGQFIAKCHQWGKFVHGFAQTAIKTDAKYFHFDSVDSSTWLRADKFGGTSIFKQGRFIVLDSKHKKDRRLHRDFYERWGFDFKKIMSDDLHEVRKSNIVAWRELGLFLQRQWMLRTRTDRHPMGLHPYLYQMMVDGVPLPARHPLLDKK